MSRFTDSIFHPLTLPLEIELPSKFTFPFYYQPHVLSKLAATDLQDYLEKQTDFCHNFGFNNTSRVAPIGKMFGVMVVKNHKDEIGYLAAFSGKLADSNDLEGFVPPIFNTLDVAGFYKQGEAELNVMNREIEALESSEILEEAIKQLEQGIVNHELELQNLKAEIKLRKQWRDERREAARATMSTDEFITLMKDLSEESKNYQIRLKHIKRQGREHIEALKKQVKKIQKPIVDLREKRAALSASLQRRIHEQYQFLNAKGETKDLLDVFKATSALVPPAGAGECAAPKLFQYAYKQNLTPIVMAEFWWGESPKSEVRKHKQFYPSCRSKCEPILGHMMKGLQVEDNPIEQDLDFNQDLEILFEDSYLLVVNKPHEFLSVPGKNVNDSVLSRMKQYLPEASGPLLVHRLDMSTSGILLVAKSNRIHKKLQKQFIDRTIKKRYVALLDGVIEETRGIINLPLRVDLDNRPQQLVCYDYGKPAETEYEVISLENGKTRVYFYPVTGRTHQLRVHAAHTDGLKTPIVGDDLYGRKLNRLHLHAESLSFKHPITKEQLVINCEVPF